jgi:hypothetical protein
MTANNGNLNGLKASSKRLDLDQQPQNIQKVEIGNQVALEINSLVTEIQALVVASHQQLEDKIQQELSKLLSVLRQAGKLANQKNLAEAETLEAELKVVTLNLSIAIAALKEGKNFLLAKKLRQDAESALRKAEKTWQAWFVDSYKRFLHSARMPTKILTGLMVALPIYICVPAQIAQVLINATDNLVEQGVLTDSLEDRNQDIPIMYDKDFIDLTNLFILSIISGATGSIISILTRIDEYKNKDENEEYEDSILPIVIGVIKPVVGAGFGVLVFAIIASQILPISLGHTNDQKRQDLRWLSFVAITFVAGFSERLVKDIISQTEEQFVTTKIDGRTQMLLSTTEDEEVS